MLKYNNKAVLFLSLWMIKIIVTYSRYDKKEQLV